MEQALTCRMEHSINFILIITSSNRAEEFNGLGSFSAGRKKKEKAQGMSYGMLQEAQALTFVLNCINNVKLFSVVE